MITRGIPNAAIMACLLCASGARAATDVGGAVDGTWTVSGSPYVCTTTDISVSPGHTLTIQPGVTVQFAGGRRLQVAGTLNAAGTSAAPIRFTSAAASPAAGAWKQIQFLNAASAVLKNVSVEWAGQGVGVAAVQIGGSGSAGALNVSLDSCTVSNCVSFGVAIGTDAQLAHTVAITGSSVKGAGKGGVDLQSAGSSDVLTITGNDFSGNSGPPVQAKAQALLAFSGGLSALSGNLPSDTFYLPTFQTFSSTMTLWNNVTFEPGAGGGPTVAPGATLTVQKGVTLRFDAGQALDVRGALNVVGTADSPVTFTGAAAAPGAWQGVWVHTGASATLDHGVVMYAGGGGAPALLSDGADVTVAHSEIANCSSNGVQFQNTDLTKHALVVTGTSFHDITSGSAADPAAAVRIDLIVAGDTATIAGNSFAASDLSISLEPAALPILNAGPDAVAGNTPDDTIVVDGGPIPDGTILWEHAKGLGGLSVPAGSVFTMAPASALRLSGGDALTVSGMLNVGGKPGQVVVLNGAGAAGSWGGIRLAPGATATLVSAVIEGAGSAGSANVAVNSAALTADGCAFLDGAGPGVSIAGTVSVTVLNSIFRGNAGPAIDDAGAGPRNFGNTPADGNDILGAPAADTAVNDWQEAVNNYWGADSGPYHPTLNPDGKGGTVTDHIHFAPYASGPLTEPVAVLTPLTTRARGQVPILGTAATPLLAHWIVSYGLGDPPASWTFMASGANNVQSGLITTWNTAGLDSRKVYSVRLQVTDVLGRTNESIVVTPSPLGDVNGDGLVEVADAVATLRFARGLGVPTPAELKDGDVRPLPKPDGVLTVEDAIAILQTAGGLYGKLP